MNRSCVIIGALTLACLSGCGGTAATMQPLDRTPIQLVALDGHAVTIRAELARTPAEQTKGLQGRTSLPEDEGMLFLFPQSRILSFWMRNTLIPLEILFFDEQGLFVSAAIMQPCDPAGGLPCPTYTSIGDARYALEVSAGSMQAFGGVGEGWRLALGPWATP